MGEKDAKSLSNFLFFGKYTPETIPDPPRKPPTAKVLDEQPQRNILDGNFFKSKTTAGCVPNIEQLKIHLEKAKDYTSRAQTTVSFVQDNIELKNKLLEAANAITLVNDYVHKSVSAIDNLSAACEISEAVAVLNKWIEDPSKDKVAAAAAFDKLFGGVAHFAEGLPVAIRSYSKILSQISVGKFFEKHAKMGQERSDRADHVGNTSSDYPARK